MTDLRRLIIVVCVSTATLGTREVCAQDPPAADRGPLPPAALAEVLRRAADELRANYVFPEMGAQLAGALQAAVAAGTYDACSDGSALAERLTEDLQAISRDRHLRVRSAPPRPTGSPDPVFGARAARRDNFGFRKAELLDGNVGYVKFDGFDGSPLAQRTAAGALAFVAFADALIFDLRDNRGGSPEMIKFISSYLFDQPTHLNSFIGRDGQRISENWTAAEVTGRRFRNSLPVYVLISQTTFSAAEEFTYNLQARKRAVIVGQRSGGGAHPVRGVELGSGLLLSLPHMRAENPVTGRNWEGTGIVPDIECAPDEALERALADARAKIAAASASAADSAQGN